MGNCGYRLHFDCIHLFKGMIKYTRGVYGLKTCNGVSKAVVCQSDMFLTKVLIVEVSDEQALRCERIRLDL